MGAAQSDSMRICDMHVHLGFIANAPQVVVDAAADGLALFANTVTPEEYVTAREEAWSRATNVRMGVGMHPWWVADGRVSASDVQLFCELAADAHYIGEIGLDFSAEQIQDSLQHALAGLEQIRGESLQSTCRENASRLLA